MNKKSKNKIEVIIFSMLIILFGFWIFSRPVYVPTMKELVDSAFEYDKVHGTDYGMRLIEEYGNPYSVEENK